MNYQEFRDLMNTFRFNNNFDINELHGWVVPEDSLDRIIAHVEMLTKEVEHHKAAATGLSDRVLELMKNKDTTP